VTDSVEAMLPSVAGEIARQIDTLRSHLPHVAVGEHCHNPYECPFLERCWPALPPNHIATLYSIGRRAQLLQEQGFETIEELPPDLNLSATADRQRRAVQAGTVIVEPELKQALEVFPPPIAFLDFETVGPAIPVWNECRPYDAVPVQFSCDLQDADGVVTHEEWLAAGPNDPRPQLAERLIAVCERARTVVAYSAGFERQCLDQLAELLPRQRAQLKRISARLVDLLQIVRSHVYHPAFGGSFSLKSVLPALVPEMRYDGLVIADGATASATLERMLLRGNDLAPAEKERLREALLTYCRQDTFGLVRILQRLRDLAG
jgi:predicted RecB family nuclease